MPHSWIHLFQFTLPTLILMLGGLLLQTPWNQLSHPRIDAAVYRLKKQAPILFVGNSITSTVNTQALSKALDTPVQNVAMEGALPAHWSALIEQGHIRYDIQPRKIIIYVSAHNLLSTRLNDEQDIALLKLLAPHFVPQLEQRALGKTDYTLFPNRIALRDTALKQLSSNSLKFFWPAAYPFREQAIANLLGSIRPRNQSPPSAVPNVQRTHQVAQEAQKAPVETSIMPLLITQAQKLNAQLIVVLPAQSQALPLKCNQPEQPEGIDWLVKQGVTVVDFRSIPMDKSNFTSLHHLSKKGAQNIVPWLVKALEQPSGKMWIAGCEP